MDYARLCPRVNFRARRIVRDGVGYVGLVSAHRTQVNNQGFCKRIDARFVLDPGRGVLGVALSSEGRLCYGGFKNVGGAVMGTLRGVLIGHLVLFYTIADCVPAKANRDTNCRKVPNEGIPWQCFADIAHNGRDCIYCVQPPFEGAKTTQCSILQDVEDYPCAATGTPGGSGIVLPLGATVVPDPTMFDIHGKADPFYANDGRTGLVRYYLQPQFQGVVDPVWMPPGYEDYCILCPNWLCYWVDHYLTPSKAWALHCTTVLKDAELAGNTQACCHPPTPYWPWWWCSDSLVSDCLNSGGKPWGLGTKCANVLCGEPDPFKVACCLPDGQCVDVGPLDCLAMGGYDLGTGTTCHHDQQGCAGGNVNLQLREIKLFFQDAIGIVQFNFGRISTPCFRLADNFCFTSGPDTNDCGGPPCWAHLGDSDNSLIALDTINVDCSMRWAEDDAYPHREPACIRIANEALRMAGERVDGVHRQKRDHSFDEPSLNRWWMEILYACHQAPVIAAINVLPFQTACNFPAELVIRRILMELWLSGDPGNTDWFGQGTDEFFEVRILAKFICQIELDVRLLPGWQEIDCPIQMTNTPGAPCTPVLSDSDRYMILASDGCTHVPKLVRWRGIHGPRPWSRGPFEYEARSIHGGTCCDILCGVDDLVIPGEIDNTIAPDGMQRYGGDVVLAVNTAGCGGCRAR